MAAAYVRDPAQLTCARVTASVGGDRLLPWFDGGPALLLVRLAGLPTASTPTAEALYCDVAHVEVSGLFP